jgi:hypothetical protein
LTDSFTNVCAIMTLPRVGWNDSWGCVYNACARWHIPIITLNGAFWDQSFQRLLEGRANLPGCDWIMCIDYDSMFTQSHVKALMERMHANPHIDALAALQCRRGDEGSPLFGIIGVKPGDKVEVGNEPLAVDSAHFGLTLLKCEKLRQLPKPWCQGIPDSNGSWEGLDRVDADAFFWRKWRAAGFTCYVDPMVNIGHLQLLVSEFDEQGRPRHVHVHDWRQAQIVAPSTAV